MKVLTLDPTEGSVHPALLETGAQLWSDVDTPAGVDAKIAAAIAAEVTARNAAIAAALVAYSTTTQMNAAIAAATAALNLASGTYAPVFTQVSGTGTMTGPTASYMRDGNVVTVACLLQVGSAGGAGTSVWKISLPIATTSLVGTGGVLIPASVTGLPPTSLANGFTGPPSTAIVSIVATGVVAPTNANFFFQYLVA